MFSVRFETPYLWEYRIWHQSILVEPILYKEGSSHALVHNEAFPWSENNLGLPRGQGTLLICVLQEAETGLPNLNKATGATVNHGTDANFPGRPHLEELIHWYQASAVWIYVPELLPQNVLWPWCRGTCSHAALIHKILQGMTLNSVLLRHNRVYENPDDPPDVP